MDKNYKNIYMFKNPIRHFLNVENLSYPTFTLNVNEIEDYAPTKPIKFTIRKYYGVEEQRELLMPNLLNFALLYSHVKTFPNFNNIENISQYSRISANIDTGDFKAYVYQKSVESDLLKLTIFDTLFRFDIKAFYNTLYTHYLVRYTKFSSYPGNNDRYITWLNKRKTSGILAGNYISLYLVEFYLKEIMEKIKEELVKNNIYSVVNCFSDDIYIFSNNSNENKIKEIVNEILSRYDLESNSTKYDKYDYIRYNNENIVTKYWKAVISKQKEHEKYIDTINDEDKDIKYNLNFTNQLIYRLNKLNDPKLKAIFIKNFFKSNFFTMLEPLKYNLFIENLHQFQYIMREYPESILYIMPKLSKYSYVQASADKFFNALFHESLNKNYYEEQIYILYGMYMLHNGSIRFKETTVDKILSTNNQLLKSYIVSFFWPDSYNLKSYLKKGEENWFINYHIILKLKDPTNIDTDIDEYLIPDSINEKLITNPTDSKCLNKKAKYHSFYKDNLLNKKLLIKDLSLMKVEIEDYLLAKIDEKETDTSKASFVIDF